ncbi:MAG: HAMP domain-containing histidine kinase, partial [Clostridia bacterium]|nr:HAMP domain-containing histidine kinase [Clostridia bacterium]
GINEVKPTTFDLSAYTYEVLERFEYLKETKGYDLRAEIEDGIFTFADEKKIGQVLYNLIGNAVNYTGEDKKVVVRVKKCSETEAYFAVTDTGEGIPEEELPTIWERYYRSAEMHKRPVKGTGLGLSIVRVILEMHRFKFGVKSELGKGSTFYVVFPLRKGE